MPNIIYKYIYILPKVIIFSLIFLFNIFTFKVNAEIQNKLIFHDRTVEIEPITINYKHYIELERAAEVFFPSARVSQYTFSIKSDGVTITTAPSSFYIRRVSAGFDKTAQMWLPAIWYNGCLLLPYESFVNSLEVLNIYSIRVIDNEIYLMPYHSNAAMLDTIRQSYESFIDEFDEKHRELIKDSLKHNNNIKSDNTTYDDSLNINNSTITYDNDTIENTYFQLDTIDTQLIDQFKHNKNIHYTNYLLSDSSNVQNNDNYSVPDDNLDNIENTNNDSTGFNEEIKLKINILKNIIQQLQTQLNSSSGENNENIEDIRDSTDEFYNTTYLANPIGYHHITNNFDTVKHKQQYDIDTYMKMLQEVKSRLETISPGTKSIDANDSEKVNSDTLIKNEIIDNDDINNQEMAPIDFKPNKYVLPSDLKRSEINKPKRLKNK